MAIPPFSWFVALSELLVTIAVFVVVWRNWNRRSFPTAWFWGVAIFELAVNVTYMVTRLSGTGTGHAPLSPLARADFAAHGMLSILAYVLFVVLGILAWRAQRRGRWFFPEHSTLTRVFVAVWAVSVVSGEAIFANRYLM